MVEREKKLYIDSDSDVLERTEAEQEGDGALPLTGRT